MKNTIKSELAQHAIDQIKDGVIDECWVSDIGHFLFNMDYYVIGYYNADQWLKLHNLDAFEAINELNTCHIDLFGEIQYERDQIDAEFLVNQLSFFYGEEIISEAMYNIAEGSCQGSGIVTSEYKKQLISELKEMI